MKNNPALQKVPTQNDLSHLSATRGKYWNRYDDQWSCPSCNRMKYGCVRPSKKNPWVLEIKSCPLFLDDEAKVDYQAKPICADCLDAAINLGREVMKESRTNFNFPSSVVALHELSDFVLARPHSLHLYNNNLIDSEMPKLIERARLIETIEAKNRSCDVNNFPVIET